MKSTDIAFILFLLLFPTGFAFSSDQPAPLNLDESINSVVCIHQQFYLDPSKAKNPELWGKLSAWRKKDLLGHAVSVSTGSGVIVDTRGHILTNAHVTQIEDPAALRQQFIADFQDTISREVPSSVLSPEEKFALRADVARVLRDQPFVIHVWAPSIDYAPAIVESTDPDNDLALIKVDVSTPTVALPLASSDSLRVGDDVYALGFPLATFFEEIFRTPQASLSKGIVSALRDDNWGIQHTAALNPGNSGGPLLDKFGTVVGINVGRITNANGLFFAVPGSRIIQFLKKSGNEALVTSTGSAARNAQALDQDAFEVGDSVVIVSEKGSRIAANGKEIGTSPLVYAMTEASVTLKITGRTGDRTVVLTRSARILDTVTVTIPLRPYEVSVSFLTNPAGASLIIDGKNAGSTPCDLSIALGAHVAQFFLAGYEFPDQSFTVGAGRKTIVQSKGLQLVSFTFTRPLPVGTTFSLEGQGRSFTLADPPSLSLSEGHWKISVSNPGKLKPVVLDLDTATYGREIDVVSWFEEGGFVLTGDLNNASVSIDGHTASPPREGLVYKVAAGVSHQLLVERKDFLPFSTLVKVDPGEVRRIALVSNLLPAIKKRNDLTTSGLIFLAGVGLLAGDLYVVSQDHSGSAPSPLFYVMGYGGLGLSLWGGVWFVVSLQQ